MRAYHGTNGNFKNLDVSKTSEFGLYFGAEKEVAESYGKNIHEVELSLNQVCDLRIESGVRAAINSVSELIELINEEAGENGLTADELIEDEFQSCVAVLGDSSTGIRDELMEKLSKNYDSIVFVDYTDGDEHEAYMIFDNVNYKYI